MLLPQAMPGVFHTFRSPVFVPVLCLLLFLGVMNCAVAWRRAAHSPKLEFDGLVVRLGDLARDSEYACEFSYTNRGTAPGRIAKVQTSCGCLDVDKKHRLMLPGERAALRVHVSTAGIEPPSRLVKSITVHFEDQPKAPATLIVVGRVLPDISVAPPEIRLTDRPGAGSDSLAYLTVDRKMLPPEAFAELGWTGSPEYFSIRVISSTSDRFELEVRVLSDEAPAILRPLTLSYPARGSKQLVHIPALRALQRKETEFVPRSYFRAVEDLQGSEQLRRRTRQVFRLVNRKGDDTPDSAGRIRIVDAGVRDAAHASFLGWQIGPRGREDEIALWLNAAPPATITTGSLRITYEHRNGDPGEEQLPYHVVNLSSAHEANAESAPASPGLFHEAS